MSEPQVSWEGPLRIQWACVLLERLGQQDLTLLPLLMTGLGSVERLRPLAEHAEALRSLRTLIPHVTTRRAVLQAISEFNLAVKRGRFLPSYRLTEDFTFSRLQPLDLVVEDAWTILQAGPSRRSGRKAMADPGREMMARPGRHREMVTPISPLSIRPPAVAQHDIDRRPFGPIEVPWSELVRIAEELDLRDQDEGTVRPGNWLQRLKAAELLIPGEGGLIPGQRLVLSGLKHLIGLPGVGKTTLLVLLGIFLHRQNRRAALFFPSVEVARQYMEVLNRYGVRVGLLVGQSRDTRKGHADRLAETIAAAGDGGFGHTLFGSDLFATNCVLPAFSPLVREGWSQEDAPCESIGQTSNGRLTEHLCPLWSLCGRNKAPRELVGASLWVGHVLSMDTQVPQHALSERLQYFELIRQTFDVVVFDECDDVQRALDGHGATTMSLSGADDSFHQVIDSQLVTRLAGEDNHQIADRRILSHVRDFSEFGLHSFELVHAVQSIYADDITAAEAFAGKLLTTNQILTDLAMVVEPDRQKAYPWAGAMTRFFDSAVLTAFYERSGGQPRQRERLAQLTTDLNLPLEAVEAGWDRLVSLLRDYLGELNDARRSALLDEVIAHFTELAFPPGRRPVRVEAATRLLIAAALVIAGYQRVSFATRELISQGLLNRAVVDGRASSALLRAVPQNLLGTLSGVRYQMRPSASGKLNRPNVQIDYLMLNGAPRLLMHRFHDPLAPGQPGPAVLLASATSYLQDSPAYHVAHGPHYVLARSADDQPTPPNRFAFTPIPGPRGEHLRFSGAGPQARRNLERMVDALVQDGPRGQLARQIDRAEAQDGMRRKVALVVNSYDQVRQLKTYLNRQHPEVARRAVGIVSHLEPGERSHDYRTSAQIEALADEAGIDLLIFPMMALGRGVNVVFTRGAHRLKAAIGSVYFLTRPHPGTDDLTFLVSLAARATQEFDALDLDALDLTAADASWKEHKTLAFRQAHRLLREPLRASRLPPGLFRAFTANQMVPVLQTIGRATRGGLPAHVFFVDAAWAPKSARKEADTPQTSMLVMMRQILGEHLQDPDPVVRATYQALYGPAFEALTQIEGVVSDVSIAPLDDPAEPESEPSPYLFEDYTDYQAWPDEDQHSGGAHD